MGVMTQLCNLEKGSKIVCYVSDIWIKDYCYTWQRQMEDLERISEIHGWHIVCTYTEKHDSEREALNLMISELQVNEKNYDAVVILDPCVCANTIDEYNELLSRFREHNIRVIFLSDYEETGDLINYVKRHKEVSQQKAQVNKGEKNG